MEAKRVDNSEKMDGGRARVDVVVVNNLEDDADEGDSLSRDQATHRITLANGDSQSHTDIPHDFYLLNVKE